MTPTILFEIQLLDHLKNIRSKINDDTTGFLNEDLQEKINDFNRNSKTKILIIILAIIILIGAFINVGQQDIPYWNYFILPYVLLILIIVIHTIKNYRKLNQNIKTYEQQ
jgi:uncharacterized membrane protein